MNGISPPRTAWIRYIFAGGEVTIQLYRYSWIRKEKTVSVEQVKDAKKEVVRWGKVWGIKYIKEPIADELKREPRHK